MIEEIIEKLPSHFNPCSKYVQKKKKKRKKSDLVQRCHLGAYHPTSVISLQFDHLTFPSAFILHSLNMLFLSCVKVHYRVGHFEAIATK